MANEMFTQLPTVTSAQLTDIICAVQGNVSVQETLQQVVQLGISQSVLNYPGNPNGHVAGYVYQFCVDTTDQVVWVCVLTGTSAAAVWIPVMGPLSNGQLYIGSSGNAPVAANISAGSNISIASGPGSITISGTSSPFGWTAVTGATQSMVADNGYWVDYSGGLCTLTLPATAAFGTILNVIGNSATGWTIAQNAGQNIQIGAVSSTAGTGGSVSSTNQYDSLSMVCVVADTTWQCLGAPQGNLTII